MEEKTVITASPEELRFGVADAIAVAIVWLSGFGSLWLLVTNYKGDQSVSLENAVAWIIIGVVLVSLALVFRGLIIEWVRSKMHA